MLLEEAEEVRGAAADERLEELADVYEVLCSLALHSGHDVDEVRAAAAAKRDRRCGFEERIWLERW